MEIEAAAGRPSGRRPFITTGGMGALAPIITSKEFNREYLRQRFISARDFLLQFPTLQKKMRGRRPGKN